MLLSAMELQLVLRDQLLQSSDELAAEDSTQCVDREKETP